MLLPLSGLINNKPREKCLYCLFTVHILGVEQQHRQNLYLTIVVINNKTATSRVFLTQQKYTSKKNKELLNSRDTLMGQMYNEITGPEVN